MDNKAPSDVGVGRLTGRNSSTDGTHVMQNAKFGP